jgi:hypothetical protein
LLLFLRFGVLVVVAKLLGGLENYRSLDLDVETLSSRGCGSCERKVSDSEKSCIECGAASISTQSTLDVSKKNREETAPRGHKKKSLIIERESTG